MSFHFRDYSALLFLLILLAPLTRAFGAAETCQERFSRLQKLIRDPSRFEVEALSTLRKPAVDSEELKTQLATLWADNSLSIREKAQKSLLRYQEMRLAEMPPERRGLAEKVLREIELGNSLGHYDPRSGKMQLSRRFKDNDILFSAILVHELEHLEQFGSEAGKVVGRYPRGWERMFVTKAQELLDRIRIMHPESHLRGAILYEPEAIGAEWDLLQAIPAEARKQGAKDLLAKAKLWNYLEFKSLADDLLLADLSREDYIKRISAQHGYTLGSPTTQFLRRWLNRFAKVMFVADLSLTGYTAKEGGPDKVARKLHSLLPRPLPPSKAPRAPEDDDGT